MSNTVITNYTDLNGPSTKADSSVVVIVNKDGSLSVDQNLLGTLMGTDGSQAAGISVVRVGHEGKPDDATDSEDEDEKVPHVTLSVDSYYDEPNSIIKYDSGAEMLQSLRIETRENSLVGFQNDHCYTPLKSPSQSLPQRMENYASYDEPVYEITHTPPPKPIPNSKKITIIEEQIIPKGKKIIITPTPTESSIVLKGNDVLNKPLPILPKSKYVSDLEKSTDGSSKGEETLESSSLSSGESIPDRDSDSDYKDSTDRSCSLKVKRTKLKPRILKSQPQKISKLDSKVTTRIKTNKGAIKKEIKEKIQNKNISEKKQPDLNSSTKETKEILLPATEIALGIGSNQNKVTPKPAPKPVKKERKTPAHVTALLSDMTSLFSTPDVIRRVSTDNKNKNDKDSTSNKKINDFSKQSESNDAKTLSISKVHDDIEKIPKHVITQKTYGKKDKINPTDKVSKGYDLIPQLDDASLAQILQDTTSTPSNAPKTSVNTSNALNSPGMAGPLSPTLQQLDLLGGLHPEEEGLTEDILMHVAQLVESSENLQEVIDKQVLGKVDPASVKTSVQSPFQQQQAQTSDNLYTQTPVKTIKTLTPKKDPIEIIRRDGRVITLPPIEAPATRASKRKTQIESTNVDNMSTTPMSVTEDAVGTPEPRVQHVSKQYVNKKLTNKKQEPEIQTPILEKVTGESQESWNSEDDPNRLWCICKQPHNNRFMICCDSCEDWFHGKCVNVTKAMGQQMEEQGIEWRCPNCTKKAKATPNKNISKITPSQKKHEVENVLTATPPTPPTLTMKLFSKTSCIVCKKSARSSSIYCSDACILKHAQDSLGNQSGSNKTDIEPGKSQEKLKSESRVIVYERKTGRLLAGPNAPTAENLKTWLQKNPTFEVVRPGTLSTIKPKATVKKSLNEPNKIQTTLNFARIPKKLTGQSTPVKTHSEPSTSKMTVHTREEVKAPQTKPPVTPKASQHTQLSETPKSIIIKSASESKKATRTSRSMSTYEKASVSPSTSRRKEPPENKSKMSNSVEPIRENVRKALQEQMSIRMVENTSDAPKFTEDEIQQFAFDTEIELHELFNRDVGMKYKAKYRSLMFNIKDRKNLSLWQKICDRTITPKQLVRLSPEELASQELAQWRAKEEKHQLELIKKSELDLLAASKTYVLKTHKGEEVMETKEPVKAELDASVPVEDLVTALNEEQGVENALIEGGQEVSDSVNKPDIKKHSSKKKEDSHKKRSRVSKRDWDSRKSRSSRRSDTKDKEEKSSYKSDKKLSREKSSSRDRSKIELSKEKSDSNERSRYRSRSRGKSRKKSKSREHSRSSSQSRERSRSRGRSKRRSRDKDRSRDNSRQRHRSRSKHRLNSDEKVKHRSRSQDNVYGKSKNDSTDSDSVERPKSAMMKEVHPEYDPHEPMITSAFSEEDLRKSREDVYEDGYKNEIEEYDENVFEGSYIDPSKTFSLDENEILHKTKLIVKRDKISEGESDQEPSSTMEHSTAVVWNGCINMVDVARFYVAAHEVSGNTTDLEEDLSPELDIVGRINPDTVWDYISKMKRASNKDIIVLKLQAANDEEKMQYIALYSYLSSRNRLGVVKVSNTTMVKDFYIVPLPANTALPSVLLPLDGPGLGEVKTHLLLAIVIRQRKKRLAPHIAKDIIPAKVARESRKRSYTPPLASAGSFTPPTSPRPDRPGRPGRRGPLPLPAYTSPALSTSVKDKIAATLASADDQEAYSPGSSSSDGSVTKIVQPSNMLQSKMEELNRQIEEQKQQIRKMTGAESPVSGEDEAYSPSRPMTPPSVAPVPLSDIALPSNLQEILATIKQRSETASSDVDMRTLPLPQ